MNYQQLAARTCPAIKHHRPDLIPVNMFLDRAIVAVDAADQLDAYKKALAYGKALGFGEDQVPIEDADPTTIALLHMGLGIITEAAEFLRPILEKIDDPDGPPLDEVNLQEELGDVAWYRANALALLGQTVEENDAQNIAKLQKRFPDKFDAERAETRDLVGERAVLEGKRTPGDVARLNTTEREVIDKATDRVDAEVRLYEATIYAYGPGRDRIRAKNTLGDHIDTGVLKLQPFIADNEYGGKYQGFLMAVDEDTVYRIIGELSDERQPEGS